MRGVCTFSALGRFGRLANGLYQVCGVIGIARRNGMDFGFPQWINYDHRDRFGSSEDVEIDKYFAHPLPRYEGPKLPDRFIGWGYQDVVLTQSTDLAGHFQSTRYFSHCIDEVRWYLRMKDEPPLNDYVAVHFRGKDYGSDYHPRMPSGYYEQAMSMFPGARFLVFSDEIETARKLFGSSVEYSEGDYLEDFRRMKTCSHFIIANSSYSAMAAVLGEAKDKQVVAPRPWFGKVAGITGADIYEPSWTVINWSQEAMAA